MTGTPQLDEPAVPRPAVRRTARILVLDRDDRILLIRTHWDRRIDPPRWITPGGGIDEGESAHDAAVRELFEETGQRVERLGAPVWQAVIPMPAGYKAAAADATFFLWRTDAFEPVNDNWTESEHDDVVEWAWFDAETLRTSPDAFDPEDVRHILAAVTAPMPPRFELDGGEVLRPISADDWPLEQALSRVPDVPRFTYYPADLDDDAARMRAAAGARMPELGIGTRYVIETAAGIAGTAGIARQDGGVGVFYALLPDFRGRGLVTRSVAAFARWAFEVGYPRITLQAYVENEASAAVAQRLGFRAVATHDDAGRAVTEWELRP